MKKKKSKQCRQTIFTIVLSESRFRHFTTDGDQHRAVNFYLHDVVDVGSGDDQLVFSQSGRQHCRQIAHTVNEYVQEEI